MLRTDFAGNHVDLSLGLQKGAVARSELTIATQDFQIVAVDGCTALQIDDDAKRIAQRFEFQTDRVDRLIRPRSIRGNDDEQILAIDSCHRADAVDPTCRLPRRLAIHAAGRIGQFDRLAIILGDRLQIGFHGPLIAHRSGSTADSDTCGQFDRVKRLACLLRLAYGRLGTARTGKHRTACEQHQDQNPIHR